MHIATLSSITSDDAASGAGDDAVNSPAGQTDTSNNAGAGSVTSPASGTATDPAPILGPVLDKNSAWDEHLVGTSGAGSLTANLWPTMSEDAAAGGGAGNVSPASSDNSLPVAAFGVGDLSELMSGAGVIGPSGFGAGSVLAGVGSDGSANGLTGAGVSGSFAALTGAFASPPGQAQDISAGSLNLDSQLSQLVQAMATYSAGNPGFVSSPVAQVSDQSGLLGVIAAAGHL